jgi:hypothetical protein
MSSYVEALLCGIGIFVFCMVVLWMNGGPDDRP